jgi:hypothetical protein
MRGAIFGLVALVPAAVNAAVPAAPRLLAVALCGGDGLAHPLIPSRQDGQGCCTKACHTGNCRKRTKSA